jgi:hypothetical protein
MAEDRRWADTALPNNSFQRSTKRPVGSLRYKYPTNPLLRVLRLFAAIPLQCFACCNWWPREAQATKDADEKEIFRGIFRREP